MFGADHKYNLILTPIRDEEGYPTRRTQHYTFMFQTYVLMNIFNQFNCRFIGGDPELIPDTYNIFRFIFSNWWFLIVVLGELNFQYAIVSYPGLREIFGCTPLSPSMHVVAWLFGIGSWGAGALTKLIPYSVAQRLPTLQEKKSESKTKDVAFGEALENAMNAKKGDILESLLEKN
jgi:magnesium-transporting ATPase (P-type)